MSERTMLMLETGGIQEFVFGSNNLRVNVGASALVKAVTDQWLPSLLPDLHFIGDETDAPPAGSWPVESIYIGGGNALLLFRDATAADDFVRQLSTRLLLDAPGLRAIVERRTIRWDQASLPDELRELRGQLARRKAAALPGLHLPGLGVTAACAFTGEPAAEARTFGPNDPSPTLISDSVRARLCYFVGKKHLKNLLPPNLPDDIEPVSDFDDFGTHGESSYIAIVHADGNRMGERIERLADHYDKDGDRATANDAHARRLAAFSQSAHAAATTALRETLAALWSSQAVDEDGQIYWQRRHTVDGRELTDAQRERLPKVVLKKNDQRIFPFRPVVFGGDDVTFICDGRLGLALAHHYLTAYGRQTLADGELAVGRAGVAIVHAHFPFAQGYALAEALAASAKQAGDEGKMASLDWHFGVNGVISALSRMRQDGYKVPAGNLAARPLPLAADQWKRWSTFEDLVGEFQTGANWAGRRNKVKALMGTLRAGRDHTGAFLENYRLRSLPEIPGYPTFALTGWSGQETPYFDALEMLDLYIPLESPQETTV